MNKTRAFLFRTNHIAIYLCVVLIAGSGIALNLQSGVAGAIMSGTDGFSMYENMSDFICGKVHMVLTKSCLC